MPKTKMTKIHGIPEDLDFEKIFESESSIRFIGVCNLEGQLLDAQYRDEITPLMSDTGLQFAAIKSAIRATTRVGNNGELGNPIYSVTAYDNIKKASIPFGKNLLLLVTFEKNQEESKVMKKILDCLNVTHVQYLKQTN